MKESCKPEGTNLMSNLSTMERNGNSPAKVSAWQDDEDFVILSPHSATGVRDDTDAPRINCIATISAGFKNERKLPDRSKNGEFYINGKPHKEFCDAPGLEEAAKANDYKRLTVVFPSDRKNDFIQQRFTEYSATALKTFGDQHSVTEIVDTGRKKKVGNEMKPEMERHIHDVGTPEYAAAIARCRVSYSVYFVLAQWTPSGANIYYPDGVGLYRIRFTSPKSMDAFRFAADYTKRMTGGVLAGIPFDIFLEQKEGADADGVRRKSWIWQARTSAAAGGAIDAAMYRQLATHGQQQVQMMQLQAPEPETIETAIADAALATVIDDDAVEGEVLSNESQADPEPPKIETDEPKIDVAEARRRFFALAKGTWFETDEGRALFCWNASSQQTKSLKEILETLTNQEGVDDIIDQLRIAISADANKHYKGKTYENAPAAAAPDPLKRHKKKIISQAKELWGEDDYKAKLPSALGQKNWDGLTSKDLDHTIAMLNRMILANAKPATPPAAAPDLELTPDEPENLEPAKTPLSAAVREKREAASAPAIDEEANLFDDDDDDFNVTADGEVIE
jgi:hypothetical protein